MKVIVKSTTKHELILDTNGKTSTGQYYIAILDVLDDDSADENEKTRTIVEIIKGGCPDSTTSNYAVYVFSDEGYLTFAGEI